MTRKIASDKTTISILTSSLENKQFVVFQAMHEYALPSAVKLPEIPCQEFDKIGRTLLGFWIYPAYSLKPGTVFMFTVPAPEAKDVLLLFIKRPSSEIPGNFEIHQGLPFPEEFPQKT